MVNVFYFRRLFTVIVCMLAISVSLSSCDTLKKKFTRKKKGDQQTDNNFIPVLEPEEYPTPEQNPLLSYKQHFSLAKVWYRDIWQTVTENRNESDKTVRYKLKQLTDHLDVMENLTVDPKKAEFAKLKQNLKYFEDSLNSPSPLRNVTRIQSDLRAFDRKLRKDLGPDQVKDSLVKSDDQG